MSDNEMITKNADGWQLDKRVNLFSVIALIVGLAGWVFAISERVAVNEHAIENQAELVKVQIQAIKEFGSSQAHKQNGDQAEIIRRLERIEDRVNQNAAAATNHINGSTGN